MHELDDDLEATEGSGRPGSPVDLGRLFRALLRHWRYIPLAVGLGAVIGIVVAKTMISQEFRATAVMVYEPDPKANNSSLGNRELQTMVDSVKLPVNLGEIRKRLKLGDMPLEALGKTIEVWFDGRSNLITVEAADASATGAAQKADTTIEVFLEHRRRLEQARKEETVQSLRSDLEVARAKLASAREAYDAFRAEHGVSDIAEETEIAIELASDLRAEAEAARIQAEVEEARTRKLATVSKGQRSMVVQSESQSNPTGVALADARSQLAALESRLSEDHPKIKALRAQVAALESRASRGEMVRQGINLGPNQQLADLKASMDEAKAQREAAIERWKNYQQSAQQAQDRLKELGQVEGQAATLLNDIAVSENHMTDLEMRLAQAIDAARNASPGFRILTPAEVPEYAEKSKRKIVAVMFPVLFLLVAVAAILASELKGLRVHTATEAGFWANAPVVGSSTWPRESEMLPSLMDELADYAPRSNGTTLVLGATANEAPLAKEVASRLREITEYARQRLLGARATEPEYELPGKTLIGMPAMTESAHVQGSRLLGSSEPPAGMELAHAGHQGALAVSLRHAAPDALPSGRPPADGVATALTQAWDGPSSGPSLRRAARLADRVLVLVRSNSLSIAELAQIRTRLGRRDGIGILMVGLTPELAHLPDRVGEVERFWHSRRAS